MAIRYFFLCLYKSSYIESLQCGWSAWVTCDLSGVYDSGILERIYRPKDVMGNLQ